MGYRVSFIVGVAVGFVLGARAGRERYEQLKQSAQRVRENPAVRNAAESAAHNGREMATRAYDTVNDRVGHRLPDSVSEKVHSMAEPQVAADGGQASGASLDEDWRDR